MAALSRFWNLLRGKRHSREIDDELAFHLDMRTHDNVASGMSKEEARRDARRRFGNVTAEKERTRDAGIFGPLDSLAQDLRYALRAIRSSRGVAALVITALALGIGANTAIFTITNALILRSLPVKDPAHLVHVPVGNFMSWGYIESDDSFTYPLWKEFTARQDVLTGVFAYADTRLDLVLNGDIKETRGAFVTSPMFRTLGIDPAIGRTFDAADEAGDAAVAVLSYALWQREFASDPAAVGRTLVLEGKPFTIIGVLRPGFFGLTVGSVVDFYLPLAAEPYLRGRDSAFLNPLRYFIQVFGRLRPGIAPGQARARLAAISKVAMQLTLPSELPQSVHKDYLRQQFVVRPAQSGLSYVRSYLERPLAVLSAIVGLLLLLACFTVANLLLARATARQREIAVRIALGASRGRIVRQLLIESMLLALVGAGVGVFCARAGTDFLLQAYSTASDPLALDISPDWRVFGFAVAAATLSAIVFGLAPALRAAHVAPADTLKTGTATVPSSVLRIRQALLAGQIAIAIILLTGAVLFGGTLWNLLTTDTGFERDRVLLTDVDLRRTNIPANARQRFYAGLLARIQTIPQVELASLCYVTPISGSTWQFDVQAETPSGPKPLHTHYNGVSPDFFRTFGTAIVAGRALTPNDRTGAPPVALANRAFARAAFGTENAVGRRVTMRHPHPRTVEIVGMVQDAKYRNLREDVPPTLYGAFAQDTEPPGSLSVALRTHGPVSPLIPLLRTILSREYPSLSFNIRSFSAQITDSVARERAFAVLCGLFGLLALALAAIGLYGVLTYLIAQRRAEIGIRMAIGATPADVRHLIYRQSFTTCAAGVVIGCVLALWAARFTRTMLYGVTAAQPRVYAAAAMILAAVAVVATLVPAVRASRTDPMRILRCE